MSGSSCYSEESFSGSQDDYVLSSEGEVATKPTASKKPKQGKKDDTKSMASVFRDLLKQPVKKTTNEEPDPILSRRTALKKRIDEERLDRRALAILRAERRARLSGIKVVPTAETLNRERGLRKTATRGVVQLFNAVHKHQQARDANTLKQKQRSSKSSEKSGEGEKPAGEKRSEPSFMDLLKSGPAKIL